MNGLSRLSLRARVLLTFALLGLVVSACVALVAAHFSDSYVHRLIDEMLRVEGEYLRERFADDGRTPHPRTRHFYVFTQDGTGRSAPPADLAALDPGIYEITDDRGERHVAVYIVNEKKLYVVLDIGLESVRERRLMRDLVALVLFGTLLSAWLAWLWAGRAIAPVRRLAQQVEVLEPSRRGVAKLAQDFAADEVGLLARSDERDGDGPTDDVDAIVSGLLRERADALRQKHLQVEHRGDAGVHLDASPRVLKVVIGNLLRVVTQFAEGGILRVQLSAGALLIAHDRAAGAATPIARPAKDGAERVLGLGMIRRVCERHGWVLDEGCGDNGERGFALHFEGHA